MNRRGLLCGATLLVVSGYLRFIAFRSLPFALAWGLGSALLAYGIAYVSSNNRVTVAAAFIGGLIRGFWDGIKSRFKKS